MKLFCGIDWAEGHHDVAIIDAEGTLMAKKRITDDPAGFAELIDVLVAAGDASERANRHLFNKLLGQLYHCLQERQLFDQSKAFPPTTATLEDAA